MLIWYYCFGNIPLHIINTCQDFQQIIKHSDYSIWKSFDQRGPTWISNTQTCFENESVEAEHFLSIRKESCSMKHCGIASQNILELSLGLKICLVQHWKPFLLLEIYIIDLSDQRVFTNVLLRNFIFPNCFV